MNISDRGLRLIQQFEGLRLAAYDDGVGVQTIGYGHTKGVQPGDRITREQAEAFLREDVAEAEEALRMVTAPLTQNQRDALVSFVFNLGADRLKDSTLLKRLNAGDYKGAADEFMKWRMAAGKVMPGLVKRRAAERALFLSEPSKEAPVAPFIAAALPAIINAVPSLIRVFGDSPTSERNAKAAELVVEAAKQATGARNEQEVVEILSTDPSAAKDRKSVV